MPAHILALLEHPEPLAKIAECLEHLGHSVIKTKQFPEAMAALRHIDVDMIIADVHLQNGGSIFDFIRWVKGDPHLHNIPFVCFSTEPVEVAKYLSDGVRTAARALGAARYMTMETFDPVRFREEIEWLLPHDRAGNYYSEPASSIGLRTGLKFEGDGDGRKAPTDGKKEIL